MFLLFQELAPLLAEIKTEVVNRIKIVSAMIYEILVFVHNSDMNHAGQMLGNPTLKKKLQVLRRVLNSLKFVVSKDAKSVCSGKMIVFLFYFSVVKI